MILPRWLRTLFLDKQRTNAPSTAFYGLSKSVEAWGLGCSTQESGAI
jgi:hypothetical protein